MSSKILITGIAGFVGNSMARYFKEHFADIEVFGIDNLSRRGSEDNLAALKNIGCKVIHGDIRCKEDVDDLPKADWILDCAAIPTVTAGVESGTLNLINNNLTGTIFLLEKCRRDNCGFIILSTSRIYSINELVSLPLEEKETALTIKKNVQYPQGFSGHGVAENFSTVAPVSLYGATKLASETLALEYHYAFGFPVWINRCGVIAGPGQLGKIDQGIFSFWIYQYLLNKPLSFIGFGGNGKQVRDMIHPYDVFRIIEKQIASKEQSAPRVLNIGGGVENALSLVQLDKFCKEHIDIDKQIKQVPENRNFDIPLYISDCRLAKQYWDWQPTIKAKELLQQILRYGNENIDRLKKLNN
jgi:CDP-paratose 2-epimerase